MRYRHHMYALEVRLELRSADTATVFDRLAIDAVEHIAEFEQGTVSYAIYALDSDPKVRIVYEIYRDRAAFESHQKQQHTKNFLEQRDRYIAFSKARVLTLVAHSGFVKLGDSAAH